VQEEWWEDVDMNIKTIAVAIFLGVVVVLSVVQMLQLNDIKNRISTTGMATANSGSGAIDTSGWTENEKMNYDMHGIIPARFQRGSPSGAGAGMVGGC